jgi:hypothetical protein
MSDFRYKIKNFVTCYLTEILTEKSGSVRLNEHEHKLILVLVDPVDDEDVEEIVHELILQTSDNVRSKEMEEY